MGTKNLSVISTKTRLPAAADLQAEVISAALFDERAAKELAVLFSEEDFTGKWRPTARAIIDLVASGDPVTPATVVDSLVSSKQLEEAGGAAHIASLNANVPVAINLDFNARKIKQAALKRRLTKELQEAAAEVHTASDFGAAVEVFHRLEAAVKHELEKAGSGEEKKSSFKLVWAKDLVSRPPDFLLKGLFEKNTLIQIFGDPGCGKSFLAIAWACCIATGKPWCGREVMHNGVVIFIVGEGHSGLARRLDAWCIRNDIKRDDLPVIFSQSAAALSDPEQCTEVIQAIEEITEQAGRPVFIVVDTLARNFGPADENSSSDMSAFVDAVSLIRATFEATVLVVHHSGHGNKDRGRGSSNLKGALDAEYQVNKIDNTIHIRHGKPPKDFDPPAPIACELRQVELGIEDEDGHQVTSCILDPAEYVAPEAAKKAPMGQHQITALKVLNDLYAEYRQNKIESGYEDQQPYVTQQYWREACIEAGVPRKAWYRAKDSLEKRGFISLENAFVFTSD